MKKIHILFSFVILLLSANIACANDFYDKNGSHFGVLTWLSSGGTDWNQTSGEPELGDPTSELFYRHAWSPIVEINGFLNFEDRYYLKGNFGTGEIRSGNQFDNDYYSEEYAKELGGPERFSATESDIRGDRIQYVTLDFGKYIYATMDDSFKFSLFAGLQYWKERYDAYGGTVLEDPYGDWEGFEDPKHLLVLSNEVEWRSIRLGATADYKVFDRLSFSGTAVLIPYTDMHNEDSHTLRTEFEDLGDVPNVIMDGNGWGYQTEINAIFNVTESFNITLGGRYWRLMSDGDLLHGPASEDPATLKLNDLDTERYGVTLGINYTF